MQASLGKMSAYVMFSWRDCATSSIEQTVTAFLELGEAIATRWVQTAKGVLLLQMVPDNSESGAIYVFDRQRDFFCGELRTPVVRRWIRCFAFDRTMIATQARTKRLER